MKALVVLLATASVAHADDEPVFREDAPLSMDAAEQPCDAVLALPQPLTGTPCRKVAARKSAGIGTATLYRAREDAYERYAVVIEGHDATGPIRVISPPLDLYSESAMGGKSDVLGKVTAKLRAITARGQPAVALELTARFTHEQSDPETGKLSSSAPFVRRAFLICGDNAQGMLDCVTAGFGGPWSKCTARLGDDGILTHACEQEDEVTW